MTENLKTTEKFNKKELCFIMWIRKMQGKNSQSIISEYSEKEKSLFHDKA